MRALILADTKAEPDDDAGKANRDKLIAFAKEHTAAEVADLQIPKVLGPTTLKERPAVVAEVRRIMSAQTPEGIIAALQALRDRPDAGPGLAAIKVPTLVIVGSKDAVTPPSEAESLAKRIAGAKLETIAEAGHLANLERPDAFTDWCGRSCGQSPGSAALPAADERHLRRHHGQEQDVGVQRQARHVDDRPGDVLHVHRRLDGDSPVRLRHAVLHPGRHLGLGVADVDLAAGDVVLPAVQGGRLGQPGDRRAWSRCTARSSAAGRAPRSSRC